MTPNIPPENTPKNDRKKMALKKTPKILQKSPQKDDPKKWHKKTKNDP